MRFILNKDNNFVKKDVWVDVNFANVNYITYEGLETDECGAYNARNAICKIHFTNGEELLIPTDDTNDQNGLLARTNYNHLEQMGIAFQTTAEVLSNLDTDISELMSQIEMVKDAIREFIPKADSIDKSIGSLALNNLNTIRGLDMNK